MTTRHAVCWSRSRLSGEGATSFLPPSWPSSGRCAQRCRAADVHARASRGMFAPPVRAHQVCRIQRRWRSYSQVGFVLRAMRVCLASAMDAALEGRSRGAVTGVCCCCRRSQMKEAKLQLLRLQWRSAEDALVSASVPVHTQHARTHVRKRMYVSLCAPCACPRMCCAARAARTARRICVCGSAAPV